MNKRLSWAFPILLPACSSRTLKTMTARTPDAALVRSKIEHVFVIYQENHTSIIISDASDAFVATFVNAIGPNGNPSVASASSPRRVGSYQRPPRRVRCRLPGGNARAGPASAARDSGCSRQPNSGRGSHASGISPANLAVRAAVHAVHVHVSMRCYRLTLCTVYGTGCRRKDLL